MNLITEEIKELTGQRIVDRPIIDTSGNWIIYGVTDHLQNSMLKMVSIDGRAKWSVPRSMAHMQDPAWAYL